MIFYFVFAALPGNDYLKYLCVCVKSASSYETYICICMCAYFMLMFSLKLPNKDGDDSV